MALVTVDSTQIDAINAALTTLTTDTTTGLADIAAEIKSLQSSTPDPVTASKLQNILTMVGTLDTNIKAADPGPQTGTPLPTTGVIAGGNVQASEQAK